MSKDRGIEGWGSWQWLTLIGVILLSGVSVTVFAFNTFEAKGAADKVESRLEKRLDQVEANENALLEHFNIDRPAPASNR